MESPVAAPAIVEARVRAASRHAFSTAQCADAGSEQEYAYIKQCRDNDTYKRKCGHHAAGQLLGLNYCMSEPIVREHVEQRNNCRRRDENVDFRGTPITGLAE